MDYLDYLLMILAFLATLFAIRGETWKSENKGFKKITISGYITIFLALSVLCVSAYKTYKDKNKFDMSDIHLTLYAENLGSYQPDDVILANAPEAFTVDFAWLDNYATRLDFSNVRSVVKPTGYDRGPNRATLVYHSINLRKNFLERDEEPPFKYLNELNGKKLWFRVPISKFKPIPNALDLTKTAGWRFKAELIIGDKIFEKWIDENGNLEFTIDGI